MSEYDASMNRFPEVKALLDACHTTHEMNKALRALIKQSDAGTLQVPFAEGPAVNYAAELKARMASSESRRSAQEARAERCLFITDSSGRRRPRAMR